MGDLRIGMLDVLLEELEHQHTLDAGVLQPNLN